MRPPYSPHHPADLPLPAIRHVTLAAPWHWLKAGWRDLAANPLPSLAYGLLFALCGDLIILAALRHPYLLVTAISGFFLVAPLLAAGLYELSRRRAQGERILFVDSLAIFARRGASLASFGLVLTFIVLIWERLSALSFALLGLDSLDAATRYFTEILFGGEHMAFTASWFALGGILALCAFLLSVVSVPLILDHDADIVTAMMTSLRTFAGNPLPLLLWAFLLVLLTLLGFATLLFGLVAILPILGHASWHAYRELVE